jgi:hypothetical protein
VNNNDSLFWAVASIVSIALAAVFLVLFIFGLLPTATLAIWILAAVSALVLFVLLLKSPGPVSSWPYTGAAGNAAAAGSAPASGSAPTPPARICCGCNCRCRCPGPSYNTCCLRWVGALAGALAAIFFSAAFLAAPVVPIVAEVFFFLAIAAFVFEAVLLVAYAACKCRHER